MSLLVPSDPASSLEPLLPGPRCVGFCGTCLLGGVGRLLPPGVGAGVSVFVWGRARGQSHSAPCPSVQLRYLHVSRRTGGVPAGVGRPRSGASVFLPPLFAGAVGRGVATCIPSRSLFFSITRRARRCPGFAAGVAALCSVTPSFRFARISCRVGSAGSGVRVAHAYRGPFSLVLGRPLPIAASCPPSF